MNSTTAYSLPGSHNIADSTLANGIRVLVYENFATQSVVMLGSSRTGMLYEPFEKNGLAGLTASALMRGTKNRDFVTIAETLEFIGTDLTVNSGQHRGGFFGKSLAEDLNVLVDVAADVLRYPSFPAAQVDRLRGEIMTGLSIRQQDTRYRANRAFMETLYPAHHPYHYAQRGTLTSLPTITLDDIQQFHQTVYGPKDMVIVIVGAVKASDATALIERYFGDWQNPHQPTEASLPDFRVPAETVYNRVPLAGKTQSDIVMGVPGPSRFSPDYIPASIANSVLGQFGMMGRLGKSVREELGLAYYSYSALDGGMGPGPWMVVAGVNPKNVDLAIERSMDEIRRLSTEYISEDDLSDNQNYFTGHLPLQLESNEGIASSILNMVNYNLGLDYLLTYRERIFALTKEDILRVAQKYLTPDALVIGIAGPS